jgi:hypothetical protein
MMPPPCPEPREVVSLPFWPAIRLARLALVLHQAPFYSVRRASSDTASAEADVLLDGVHQLGRPHASRTIAAIPRARRADDQRRERRIDSLSKHSRRAAPHWQGASILRAAIPQGRNGDSQRAGRWRCRCNAVRHWRKPCYVVRLAPCRPAMTEHRSHDHAGFQSRVQVFDGVRAHSRRRSSDQSAVRAS